MHRSELTLFAVLQRAFAQQEARIRLLLMSRAEIKLNLKISNSYIGN